MKPLPVKKMMVTGLALAMVLGTGTEAFAKGPKNKENPSQKHWNNGWHGQKVNLDFKDTQGKEMEWAMRYIARLAARGIFDGYSDGSFRPQETVTRIEAITAAVRLMGLRDQAESAAEMQTKLNFKDADQVPAWAVGYVAVAAENDLFAESETTVHPNQPADRLWATTLLVKALGLQDEAQSKMNVKLTFADADKIPAGSVGYVAVAIEKGVVNGFEDNTFRPNQPVTRAQIAALLDRAGDLLPDSNNGVVTGTVTAPVTNNTLTLNQNGQTVSLTFDSNAFIYRAGARVSSSALQVGDVVKTLTYNNVIIFAEVTQAAGGTPTTPVQPTGVVTGTLISAVAGNVLTLTSSGQTVSLPLNSAALFFRNGAQVNASALQVGDVVSARSYNNAVVTVEVTQPAGSTGTQPSYSGQVTGTVTAAPNGNVLTLISGGQTAGRTLNSGVFVYRGGAQISPSELKAGDVVKAYTYNNVITVIEVTQSAVQASDSKGTITGTVAVPANGNVLVVTSGGQNVSLTLNANAFIYRNGVQTGAAALQTGDTLTAHYYNNAVLYAEVTQLAGGGATQLPAISQTSGTLVSVVNNNTLTIANGGQASSLVLNANAFIYRGGALVSPSALQAGDTLDIRSYNGSVIFIEVTQNSGGSGQSLNVVGPINKITLDNQGKISKITINQTLAGGTVQPAEYTVSQTVAIYGDLSKLVPNQQVLLQGSGQTVTAIYIQ